ncbi:MAG TPA: gliding motility-associated C-terminal domain-containing protein, partial [Bacteroidia bacterium]|nr:gliding motility-associated C-terminal domain-containing protein [Bacteroidia bacterium]
VLGTKAYVGTGTPNVFAPLTQFTDFWEFDALTYTWTQKANVPGPGRRGALGFTSCNKGYLGMGTDANNVLLNDCYSYDVTSNTWTAASPFPGTARWDMSTFTIGYDVYMVGGASGTFTNFNDLWKYSGSIHAVAGPDDSICAGTSVKLTASGGNAYYWTTGDTSSTITVTPAVTTTYGVQVTNGCYIDSAHATVTVFASANASFDYTYEPCSNNCIQFLNHSVNGISYNWDFGDGTTSMLPNPCHTYTDSSIYTVSLSIDNATNCLSVQTVPLHYFAFDNTAGIFIPSLFSPNGDGKNDHLFFYRRNNFCVQYFEIGIYDRWGERIFYTNNLEASWDGTFKGELLNSGTFVYYLKLDTKTGEHREQKGSIELVR